MVWFLLLSFALNVLGLLMLLGMSIKLVRMEHEVMMNYYMIVEFHKEWKEVTHG